MKREIFTLLSQDKIARDVYKMTLSGNTDEITRPGQFVNIKIDGLFLRRPISVCDKTEESLTLIYKVVGEGTEKMSRFEKGQKLDILTGLGNGYSVRDEKKPLLIGGGVGVPPLYMLAKKLVAEEKSVTAILGFNSESDVFYEKEFKELGIKVFVATADGSYGIKGFVTDALQLSDYDYFYACGPEPMLRAVCEKTETSGQLSFEERMGCGFGACMGCTCKTKYGAKRICKEGPVLEKEEIVWQI